MTTGGFALWPTQSIGYRKQAKWARWRCEICAQSLYDQQHIFILDSHKTAASIADVANLANIGHKRRGFFQAMPAATTETRSLAVFLSASAARILRNDRAYNDIGADYRGKVAGN